MMIVDSRQPNPAVIRKLIVYGNLMATLLTKYADALDEESDVDPARTERALPQEWEKTLLEFKNVGE
ncbi:MAG: hypothetical protein ABIR48_01335 [Gammaproteobacteria bacterium]